MFGLSRIGKIFIASNFIALSLVLIVALISHSSSDPSYNRMVESESISNFFGYPGAYFSGFIMDVFGLSFYLPILFILQNALLSIKNNKLPFFYLRLTALIITLPLLSLTFALISDNWALNAKFAGFLGRYTLGVFKTYFDVSLFSLSASIFTSLLLISFVLQFMGNLILVLLFSALYLVRYLIYKSHIAIRKLITKEDAEEVAPFAKSMPIFSGLETHSATIIKKAKNPAPKASIQSKLKLEPDDYEIPSLGLLQERNDKNKKNQLSESALSQNSKILHKVLEDFGISGDITQINPGPVVTLYEFEPQAGIKSSRIIGLADDIARSMSAISARIAVISGKSALGIELPNIHREIVSLRELLQSKTYQEASEKLPLVLGKNIAGEPVIADLAKMPHLLVAGTTGSGKSVAINTMILSLLYKHSPKTCKFVMIDPKMLELSVYDGIPHLLAPVVTEAKKAVSALKWVVKEMERRYKLMSVLGVRNLEGFNKTISEMISNGEKLEKDVQVGFDQESGKPRYEVFNLGEGELPFIVVIVDEMADLMIVAGKEIEGSIQRLAQMARAAGIHIIMATQRPSVDVITGVIKANFPTRISFQVTSKIDSRTILGEQGAEQLLGMGDMLFMRGGGRLERVHGPFVSDDEVEKITQFVKSQGTPQYIETITKIDDDEYEEGDELSLSDDDGLYKQAVQIVLNDKKASTSYVQRCLRIGYNRAALLIERMEKEGIVSPPNHSGKREVLIEQ